MVGIVLAMVSAVENFMFIPYSPFWSLLIIGLNVWVIWTLAFRADAYRISGRSAG